ncbi:MAG: hypothetical protein KF685_07725 [Acidobacteria bacterium]|nr:hypothetical protein [Acidobacteriota bacterium]
MNERELVEKYCEAWNLLDADIIEPFIDDGVRYESQMVFEPLLGKEAALGHIRGKMKTIKKNVPEANVYAELAFVGSQRGMTVQLAMAEGRPCALLAQPVRENIVGLVLLSVSEDKIMSIDICAIVPNPKDAIRTGYYPGIDEPWIEWPETIS